MKGVISLCSGILALGICLSASFGFLSNENRMNNQNMFGGFGEIRSVGNYSQHFYYDDTNFYYHAYTATWNVSAFELYSYDFESGESYPVCRRISCSHTGAACHINPCYQCDSPFGIWDHIDNKFVSLQKSDDELLIRLWNPLSDTYRSVMNVPRYRNFSDNRDYVGKYESFFNAALRISDDLILIGYNNEMHIYDNDYNERFRFLSNSLGYPMTVGKKFCWLGMHNELNSIDLESGKIENNILDGLFDTKNIVSICELNQEFSAFAYEDEMYFPHEDNIYAFNPTTHSLREITEIDPLSEDNPYACFGDGNFMYYKKNGIVHCMNLDTLAVNDLPDLPKVPCCAVHDSLLFVSTDTNGINDIECYDRKQVNP